MSCLPGAPFAIGGAGVSALHLALKKIGHIPNRMHFHFLDKIALLVISVYLKYFGIKGASGRRTTDWARDVILQATRERLKRNGN